MIVLDASAIVDWLLGTAGRGDRVAEEIKAAGRLHTLDLVFVEVVSALRANVARGVISERRGMEALRDFERTPLTSHQSARLTGRIWELRESHSAYDAAYVALAEALSMPLLTTDLRLARSTGHRARIVEAGG